MALVFACCAGGDRNDTRQSAGASTSVTSSAPAAGATAPVASSAPAASESPGTRLQTPSPAPCPAGAPQASAPSRDVGSGDVDGDGQSDTFTVDDRHGDESADETLRLSTARGVRAALVLCPLYGVGVLGVVSLASGPVVLVEQAKNASNPSTIQLVVFHNCQLVFVRNVQGQPYEFNIYSSGDPNDEGVGCLGAGSAARLVGLRDQPISNTRIKWTRTFVNIEGDQARNGGIDTGIFVRGRDDHAIELLTEVSCGDRVYETRV